MAKLKSENTKPPGPGSDDRNILAVRKIKEPGSNPGTLAVKYVF